MASSLNRAEHDVALDRSLARARAGDQVGFNEIYRLLGGKVSGYLASRGVDEVEDVTNEVFIGAFRNLSTFHGNAAGFRSWLFGIAWNKSSDWHRAHAKQPQWVPVHEGSPFELVGGDCEDQSIERLCSAETVELLETLTPDQRDVLMLRIVADLSLLQVAEILGKPVGAVKSLQHRALANLKQEICTDPVSRTSHMSTTGVS